METLKVDTTEEKITCQSIINTVAEHYQISAADICSKKRSSDVAFPRQVSCIYAEFTLTRSWKLLQNI